MAWNLIFGFWELFGVRFLIIVVWTIGHIPKTGFLDGKI